MLQVYVPGKDSDALERKIKQDFGLPVRLDTELAFFDYIIPMLGSEELVSIRYTPGKTRIPGTPYGIMPWLQTDPQDYSSRQIGTLRVPLVMVAHLYDFPEGLAMLDEYDSKTSMIKDISNIYDHVLQPTDVLSAYFLAELQR